MVFSNVLDVRESDLYEGKAGETVEQFLRRTSIAEKNFSSVCEVYDPQTGETSYCAIEDDPSESMKVSVTVNGLPENPDYEIRETDLVVVQVFPANSPGRVAEAILGGILVVGGILLAWASGGASLAGTKAGIGLLIGGLGASVLGTFLVYDALRDPKEKDKKSRELAKDQSPTIAGAQNQLLEGPFPLLVGKITATPYVVGSLYNDFVIDENDHATYFGSRQKATMLLAVAYSPIYVEDIRFDNLVVAKNKNHVLSGPLYHNFIEENGSKYAENPWDPGHVIMFDGEKSLYEVESMWNSNNIKFEISQFGNHRNLYPVTIKQRKVDEAVLYCYDNEYRKDADGHTITWQGGEFPTGMRSNTVKFSESVPWKISVGIEFPSGLYRQHSTTKGTSIYTKIPMNLVIQWRPVYKYVKANDFDFKGDAEDVYEFSPTESPDSAAYRKKRFFGWRNFTDVQVQDGPVKIITYTSKRGVTWTNYWYYDGSGNRRAARVGDMFGYFSSPLENSNTGMFFGIQKSIPAADRAAYYKSQYTYKFLTKSLSEDEVNVLKNYSEKSGTSAYDYYVKGNPILESNIIKAKDAGTFTYGNGVYGVSGNNKSTSAVYGSSTPATMPNVYGGTSSNRNVQQISYEEYSLYVLSSELPSVCRDAINSLCDAAASGFDEDSYWITHHENYSVPGTETPVSERECALNKGLSEGTSTDCNPTWHGVKAFSFGAASCGRRIWDEVDKRDPSTEPGEITFGDDSYITELSYAESPMKFEISATLSKDDILELLNKNPKTKMTEYGDKSLAGLTDVTIDEIQVRVLRMTPCYINKTDGQISYKYADIVKWSYLKTYCVDKQALLDDINNLTEKAVITDPGTGTQKTVAYSKIDCSPDTFNNPEVHPSGSTWKNWNIQDYYSRPVSHEDMKKLCLLAVECEPDLLGRIASSIDKINLTGHAITPVLLKDWTRYWYVRDGSYYRCDYYDSSMTRKLSLHPMWEKDDYMWVRSSYEEFNHPGVTLITGESYEGQYWYEEMTEDWQAQFFPNKVEPARMLQIETDDTGSPVKNDLGEVMKETVRQGNDWIPYIANFMSEHQDSAGRWIATEAFRKAFLDGNAIAQVLGVMCGQSLGKDAYCYNTLNNKKFVRYWFRRESGGTFEYYYRDTDDTAYNPGREIVFSDGQTNNAYLWNQTTKETWEGADRTEIGGGYSYSMRKPGSSFNMLALKEAYEYTDAIDIGGEFGPLSYKCNMYVTSQQKVVDLMNTILACGRAFWFYDELGRLEFHNDKPRKYPVMVITDENVISQSFSRTFDKSIAGYHGTFQDENNDYQSGEIYVLREGQSRDSHTKDIIDTGITGVTDPKQMWAMLVYMLAATITRREVWEVNLTHAGNALAIGSMVELQSSILEIGTDTSGRIERLIEDDDYIYGFVTDRTYEYRAEYKDDGTNVQGCSLFQPDARIHSKVITMRFASRETQESGIHVGNTILANLPGQTNLCLLEKKILKSQERQAGQGDDEDTGTRRYTQFIPAPGDIIMFGNIGAITQRAVVYELQYDEKGKVKASLYPYFDELFTAGNKYPVYKTSMTKKARNDTLPVSSEVKRTELDKESMRLLSTTNTAISDILSGGGDGIHAPDSVTAVSAIARRDQIDVSWAFNGSGLSNAIDSYTVVLTKKNGSVVIMHPSGNSCSYIFQRKDFLGQLVDGWPEHGDLKDWTVTVTPVNIYGLAGEASQPKHVNADALYYGTWIVGLPEISHKTIDRTVVLQLTPRPTEGREVYGDIRYQIRIRRGAIPGYTSLKYWMHDTDTDEYWYLVTNDGKLDETKVKDETWVEGTKSEYDLNAPDEFASASDLNPAHKYATCKLVTNVPADAEWKKPSELKDPYQWSENYYDNDPGTQESRYVLASEVYTQTLPLYFTDARTPGAEEYNLVNTPYYFDVRCFNEAGFGDWYSGSADYDAEHPGYVVTALCTNIRDIVKANETAKEAYISELSAITANLGEITDGSIVGSKLNYWTLNTKRGAKELKDYIGAFRVGGENEFLEVEPRLTDGVVTGYSITFKVGKFEISSTNSKLNGEFIIQSSEDALERTRLTPIGTFYEYRDTKESDEWKLVAKQDTGGILSEQVYSNNTLLLSNAGIKARRNEGLDIGTPYLSSASRVYHFDTDEVDGTRQLMGDVLDQNGQTGLTVSVASGGHAKEVGSEQGDQYRPAIQVKAPYSEIGNSLAGQFSLVHSLGSGTKWTVDFWFQYTWAEGQELFRATASRGALYVRTETSEPNYSFIEDGVPPYNTEEAESGAGIIPYNVARPDGCLLVYERNGTEYPVRLKDIGIDLKPDDWAHCAVTLDGGRMTVMLSNDAVVQRYLDDPGHEVPYVIREFTGAGTGGTFSYNPSRGTALIDELLVDATAAETAAVFGEASVSKIPWGALPAEGKWLMLIKDEDAEFITNLNFAPYLELTDNDFEEIFDV